MKCPNCNFIEKDEVFGDPATCPKCGAIYEKALRVKVLKEQLEEQKTAQRKPEHEHDGVTLKDRLSSATASVSEGRRQRGERAFEKQRKCPASRPQALEDICE